MMVQPMPQTFIAHVKQSDGTQQTLATHLTETAAIAKILASKLDLAPFGELLGLMHDFGKYSHDFQAYIRAMTGIDADIDNDYELPNGKKIDHSTAGAQWVYQNYAHLADKMALANYWGKCWVCALPLIMGQA